MYPRPDEAKKSVDSVKLKSRNVSVSSVGAGSDHYPPDVSFEAVDEKIRAFKEQLKSRSVDTHGVDAKVPVASAHGAGDGSTPQLTSLKLKTQNKMSGDGCCPHCGVSWSERCSQCCADRELKWDFLQNGNSQWSEIKLSDCKT